MKKFISLLLSMAVIFSVASPAFAANSKTDLLEKTFYLADEPITLYYRLNESNRIDYIEVNSNVIEARGNEIYLNGELIAIVTSEFVVDPPIEIQPRSGWIYGDTCPFGYPSDYTRDMGTKLHNITFRRAIGELSVDIILSILITTVDTFATDPSGASLGPRILLSVAEDVYNWAIEYPKREVIYAIEEIYGHENGMGYMHRNDFTYYGDEDCTEWVSAKTMFSSWA